MESDIQHNPLARAVLRHLADTHRKDSPLGSFAQTVLNGEASLQASAQFSWHSDGIAEAFERGVRDLEKLSPEERNRIEQEAIGYRELLDELNGAEAKDQR